MGFELRQAVLNIDSEIICERYLILAARKMKYFLKFKFRKIGLENKLAYIIVFRLNSIKFYLFLYLFWYYGKALDIMI